MKEGWNKATLGDVLALIRNGTNCEQKKAGEGYKISRIETIAAASINQERVGYAALSDEQRKNFKIRINDILFSHINSAIHVGKTAIVDHDYDIYHGINLLLLRPVDGIDPRYLYHYLNSLFQHGYWRTVCKQSVNQASVNQTDIKKVGIVYPKSLHEQKRIVAILDEAFEGISAAVENAEKNLANSRELFDNYLNSVFAQTGKKGSREKLGDIAAFKNGLNFTKGSKGEIIKIVGVKDFQKNFYVPTDQLETAQIDGSLSADYELRTGDILTVRSNGNKQLIGRCILASDVPEKTSHSGFTIRIRVASEEVSPAYLVHFLKSKASREMLIESGDGANISSLNQQALSALPVSLPSRSDQLAITEKIEAIAAETKNLEAVYQQKLDSLAELKQAILQKAFAGELTTQPEKALQEAAAA